MGSISSSTQFVLWPDLNYSVIDKGSVSMSIFDFFFIQYRNNSLLRLAQLSTSPIDFFRIAILLLGVLGIHPCHLSNKCMRCSSIMAKAQTAIWANWMAKTINWMNSLWICVPLTSTDSSWTEQFEWATKCYSLALSGLIHRAFYPSEICAIIGAVLIHSVDRTRCERTHCSCFAPLAAPEARIEQGVACVWSFVLCRSQARAWCSEHTTRLESALHHSSRICIVWRNDCMCDAQLRWRVVVDSFVFESFWRQAKFHWLWTLNLAFTVILWTGETTGLTHCEKG